MAHSVYCLEVVWPVKFKKWATKCSRATPPSPENFPPSFTSQSQSDGHDFFISSHEISTRPNLSSIIALFRQIFSPITREIRLVAEKGVVDLTRPHCYFQLFFLFYVRVCEVEKQEQNYSSHLQPQTKLFALQGMN